MKAANAIGLTIPPSLLARRRSAASFDHLVGVAGTLSNVLAPLAQAQRREIPRIALMHPTQFGSTVFEAFSAELDRQGLTEGKTVDLERYSAEGHAERFPELTKEIVRRRPDVILAATSSMVLSFKAATDAKVLGLTIAPSLLARADEVID